MGHIESANTYMEQVISGAIPACEYVKKACMRQRNDLKSAKKAAFPYEFKPEKGERVCKFLETLTHTKGVWASRGDTVKLEPWQQFIFTTIFGWVKKSDGYRRYREAYIEVPRKNGKSIVAAGIGLYMFCADGEHGAEVYSGASSEKQAWEVFRPAKLMVERDAEMRDYFSIQVNAKTLNIPADMSRFEPMIGKPGDGASPSCAIHDEFHEHDTDDQHSTMKTGMGARTQPLQLDITTAGVNLGGPCYALRGDAIKTLEGSYNAPDLFAIIYTIDAADDWTSPEALRKANPNFGVSVLEEFLLSEQRKAVQSAYLQNNFKTKHLNVWCSASAAYFNMQDLEQCIDTELTPRDFDGETCIGSIDLASKTDIAVKALMFRREGHYYAFIHCYLPEETAYDPKNKQYQAWANDGYITLTPGNIIDYEWIENDLIADSQHYQLSEVPYDKWNATQFATRMDAAGVNMVDMPQTTAHFSAPMKELDALIRAKRFHFDGNPVLKWMFSNVVAKTDANDNVFPRKERNENKIDGVVAIIMALGRWLADNDTGSVYDQRFASGASLFSSR